MEIILIVLTSLFISSFQLATFYLGFRLGKEHAKDDKVIKLNKTNEKMIKGYSEYANYNG